MKPLLASLVLLLLALCRQSSSYAVSWKSVNTRSSESTASISTDNKVKAIQKIAPKFDKAMLLKLMDKLSNTIWFLGLKAENKYDGLPDFYKKAVDNGVLCELADANLATEISTAMYGAATVPDTDHNAELALAELPTEFKCDASTPNACFCSDRKALLYCVVLLAKDTYIKTTKGTCRDVALTNLKNAAPTLYKGFFEENNEDSKLTKPKDEKKDKTIEEEINALTENENVEAANAYCEMADEKVSKAVKELYAADALSWTIEELLFANTKKTVKQICDTETIAKTNPIFKCMCAFEKGIFMCTLDFMGSYFKTEGYLDCESSPKKFNADKKPKSLPAGVISEKSPSTSTASSLMMVPLMAAAVLFARH